MSTVVKKWIHQYGVAVLKNSEICDFVESRSNIEKEVLTSERNLLVLFLEWNLLWPSYARINFFPEHEQFAILPLSSLVLADVSDAL